MDSVKRVLRCMLFLCLAAAFFVGQNSMVASAEEYCDSSAVSMNECEMMASGYPAAKPLPGLSGNQCNDMIAVALSQVGYTAAENNASVYWKWAGSHGTSKSWCSEFVAWCAKSAGIPDEVIPIKWGSSGYINYYAPRGQYYTIVGGCADKGCKCIKSAAASISPYAIRTGDILLVETNDKFTDGPDHTCLAWKREGDILYTIDGNVHSGGSSAGSVRIVKRDLTKKAGLFHGVCRPPYQTVRPSGIPLTKVTAKGKKSLNISWQKTNGASGYDIYLSKCSKKKDGREPNVLVKSIRGNTIFKWTKTGLKAKTAYKVEVRSFVMIGGRKMYVAASPVMHAYTSGTYKKFTNAKKVTGKKKKISLKKGKSFKLKLNVRKLKPSKKLMPKKHAPTLRYLSTDKKIATVSKKGKIKGVSKGTCYIYAYAHNGVFKKIKVTVK